MFGDTGRIILRVYVSVTERQSAATTAAGRRKNKRDGERERSIRSGWQTASNNKLLVIGRRSSGGLVKHGSRRERVRCMPQIGSNIYAIGMITALRDYVRLLRAIPMLTLSSHHHHHHPSLLRTVPRSSPLSLSLSVYLCHSTLRSP